MTTIYTFNGQVLKEASTGKWLTEIESPVDPLNPLNLPANTIRVRTNNGNPPRKVSSTSYETATLVSGTTDVYDVYKSGTDFSYVLYNSTNVTEILGANTTNITNMWNAFYKCALTSVPLFDTSSVITMSNMFESCTSLTSIPLYDTSNVEYVYSTFYGCVNVESGALALYNQLSALGAQIANHNNTFKNCGRDTVTGAAELAQIPSSWGGTGA